MIPYILHVTVIITICFLFYELLSSQGKLLSTQQVEPADLSGCFLCPAVSAGPEGWSWAPALRIGGTGIATSILIPAANDRPGNGHAHDQAAGNFAVAKQTERQPAGRMAPILPTRRHKAPVLTHNSNPAVARPPVVATISDPVIAELSFNPGG